MMLRHKMPITFGCWYYRTSTKNCSRESSTSHIAFIYLGSRYSAPRRNRVHQIFKAEEGSARGLSRVVLSGRTIAKSASAHTVIPLAIGLWGSILYTWEDVE